MSHRDNFYMICIFSWVIKKVFFVFCLLITFNQRNIYIKFYTDVQNFV